MATSITEVAKLEKIVDYSFERCDKSNVLAIHPTRPLIAYLINIQRTPKISKGWSSGNDSIQSRSSSLLNGQNSLMNNSDKTKTVSIRIIDYMTRQRCLAKGIYHARPAGCVFTINSLVCAQADVIKMAVVDRLANVYLYDLTYFLNDLTATRIAVIRSPAHVMSPYQEICLEWCPFVPCEDFDDGDGGLRLALATDSKIEVFAIDRLQGKTGELHRSDLREAYKCILDAHKATISSLSISPDCSTISAAATDNRVTFFCCDIDESLQRSLHTWEANIADSSISKLFFLDDYPKLLDDSTMKFWGAAFIGTKSGQILLVDLRTWTVYQQLHLSPETSGAKNFDYRIDLTARNIVAVNGNLCHVIQIEHDYARLSSQSSNTSEVGRNHPGGTSFMNSSQNEMMNGNMFDYLLSKSATEASTPKPSQKHQTPRKHNSTSTPSNSGTVCVGGVPSGLPRIAKTTMLNLDKPIYSFVIKQRSEEELELFTISAYSLELFIINMNTLELKTRTPEIQAIPQRQAAPPPPVEVKPLVYSPDSKVVRAGTESSLTTGGGSASSQAETLTVDVNRMDRLVEALFTKLNLSFSQGLSEFLSEVRGEVNDLKSKIHGLSRDVNRLQQQLHESRHR